MTVHCILCKQTNRKISWSKFYHKTPSCVVTLHPSPVEWCRPQRPRSSVVWETSAGQHVPQGRPRRSGREWTSWRRPWAAEEPSREGRSSGCRIRADPPTVRMVRTSPGNAWRSSCWCTPWARQTAPCRKEISHMYDWWAHAQTRHPIFWQGKTSHANSQDLPSPSIPIPCSIAYDKFLQAQSTPIFLIIKERRRKCESECPHINLVIFHS